MLYIYLHNTWTCSSYSQTNKRQDYHQASNTTTCTTTLPKASLSLASSPPPQALSLSLSLALFLIQQWCTFRYIHLKCNYTYMYCVIRVSTHSLDGLSVSEPLNCTLNRSRHKDNTINYHQHTIIPKFVHVYAHRRADTTTHFFLFAGGVSAALLEMAECLALACWPLLLSSFSLSSSFNRDTSCLAFSRTV